MIATKAYAIYDYTMPKPITPLCGCDVFVLNQNKELLLIQRTDNNLWALPGGCQEVTETPAQCAIRECYEETGFTVKIDALFGVWSSLSYPYLTYPWKDNVFTHLVFSATIVSGAPTTSSESSAIAWFSKDKLPQLSDGHPARIAYGFDWCANKTGSCYFE